MASNTHSIDYELSTPMYSYITDGSQTGLDIAGDITMELYWKPETTTALQSFISKWLASNHSYRFYIDTNDKLNIEWSNDGSTDAFERTDAAISVSAGTWVHVAVTLDVSAQNATFYVDGSSVASTKGGSSVTSIYNGGARFVVGGVDNGAAQNIDGLVNNVRIWNDVRTSGEISDNYQKVITTTGTDNLVDSWYYNNTHDSASGNNTLTAVGSPTFSTDIPFVYSDASSFFIMF